MIIPGKPREWDLPDDPWEEHDTLRIDCCFSLLMALPFVALWLIMWWLFS